MGRKPGEITSRHTVTVSFNGNSNDAQNAITKQAKRKPTEVVNGGDSTRLVYTFKYHASAEKAMNKILNLNSGMGSSIDGLEASISG